ncbi:hypothetical protein PZH32_07695 [Adlercreutzia equolifaciens]|uniref:hypothetical protein n=1 Tax=Adlercreutzia equolifaciens TaxID=446660 RepID=UPI0023B109EE|nr:hypothetical protein [Adlercreutzia equolifaciens]MDE8702847.1 hypothetical protein [Adlercreutzia equolifaciens]
MSKCIILAALMVVLTAALCPVAAFAAEEVSSTTAAAAVSVADEPVAPEPSEPADPSTPAAPTTPAAPAAPVITCKTTQVGQSGWKAVKAPAKAGRTTGSNAVTALRLSVKSSVSGSVVYRVYLAGKGWTDLVRDGATAGLKKSSAPVQALRIKLTGKLAQQYAIYYRANVVGYGWTGWGKNGESVGARKLASVRGYQVKVVKKGSAAPGSRDNRYFSAGQSSAEYFYAQGGKTRPQLIKAIAKAKGSGLKVFGTSYSLNSSAGKKLQKAIKALSRYKLSFVMMDLTTGAGISYNPGKVQYSASTIKGPYVAAVNKYRPSSAASAYGTMSSTIKVSSNEGYASLRSRFGHSPMLKMMAYCGISSAEMNGNRNYTYLSSRTLAKLWIGTYWYYYRETNSRSAKVRGLHAHPLNSFIDRALTTPTRTKPGWFPGGGYNVQNDAGVVLVDGHPYVLSVMSSACGQYGKLAALVQAIDGVHADMVKKG